MNDTTPVISPFLAFLRSRKFWAAVVAIVVDLMVAANPSFDGVKVELLASITAIVMTFIGGVAYEDAASQKK